MERWTCEIRYDRTSLTDGKHKVSSKIATTIFKIENSTRRQPNQGWFDIRYGNEDVCHTGQSDIPEVSAVWNVLDYFQPKSKIYKGHNLDLRVNFENKSIVKKVNSKWYFLE